MSYTQNFSEPKSHKRIAHLVGLIRQRGQMTKSDLMAETGMSEASVRLYLHHMAAINIAYIAQPAKRYPWHRPAEWAVYDAATPSPDVTASVDIDDFQRRVIVRQQWEPNHVRMLMDCLLFGVPKVLQGIAA